MALDDASLGEATRTSQGHEPSTAALVRTTVRMRNNLDDPNTADQRAAERSTPRLAAGADGGSDVAGHPSSRDRDIDFKALVALLLDGTSRSWPATRATSRAPSPLKRVGDVGHAVPPPGPGAQGRPRGSSSTTRSGRAASTCAAMGRREAGLASSRSATGNVLDGAGRALSAPGRRIGSSSRRPDPSTASRRRRPRRPEAERTEQRLGPASRSSRPTARSTADRSSPGRSTSSGSPSATWSRRGGWP